MKLSILLALALGSAQAGALELGQIRVKSALGQPLVAEIPLTTESSAELQNLSARLASPEDFTRAGISGGRPAIALQFDVAEAGGQRVIRITSSEAVNDPYLDLLVEVNNAAGKSVREYTILLDPPGGTNQSSSVAMPSVAPAAPRASGSRRAVAPPAASQPAPARPAAAVRPAPASRGASPVDEGKYGPVNRGQTLSEIARLTTPAGVERSQMLLALKQANPGAFYRDNINALKRGAVLRIPTSQEAQALAAAAAVAEVQRQNSEWRGGTAAAPTTVADAATRAGTSSAPAGTPSAADRLALVPTQQGAAAAGGGGKNAAAISSLRADLQRSQEQLTALQQQGNELKSRLKDLEDINSKNERLLALKDNQIAELQHRLDEARKAANLPPAAPVAAASAKPAANAAQAAPAPAPAAPQPATAGTAAAAPVAMKAKAAPAVKPASKPAAPAPAADEPWYMQTWAWIAGAVAVVLLLLLGLRQRQKAAPAAAASSLADRFGTVPAAGGDSVDPDQDELLDQLAEHPDDIGLHLELVSLYYSRRDVDHFEAAAEAMHAHIIDLQQPEWLEVAEMGRDLTPEHPLFAEAAEREAAYAEPYRDGFAAHDVYEEREAAAAPAFDRGAYAAAPAGPEEETLVSPLPANQKVSEYHFVFDLTRPEESSPADEASVTAAKTEVVLDEAVSLHEIDTQPEEHLSWHFDEPAEPGDRAEAQTHELGGFSDDPVDTKLDLARAYMDMGDADGARAMLEEVLNEGSQMQKDTAKELLGKLA
ncbi:FimV/HubP family polar landmark protein [Frateuria defendens]|uniref:FimV/HubP family polar landmark protein n=1 Tax=Frateuria defendens TaxID=2219559 RepID=UPI001F2A0B1A|nr:FimV/HubP family polar landmark protein [Frateuria defendens]